VRGDGNLGGATLFFSKAQPIADYLVAPPYGGLNMAALVVPDIFWQPIRPFSAIHWRWRSPCAGLVSADSLATAVPHSGLGGGSRVEENVHVHTEKSWLPS
jgi:hypothetical protein